MKLYDTLLNLRGKNRLPLIRQSEASECGLACLAMIAGWHGYDIDLPSIRRRFPISLKGATLSDLIEVGNQLGLGGRALRCELEDMHRLRVPCILHWEFKHFVVLRRVDGSRAWLYDPAIGALTRTLSQMSSAFTGVALELSPAESFEQRHERTPLRLRHLWRWVPETRTAFAQAIALSLVLQFFVLLGPYYGQLVIDQAISKGDSSLLTALAIAFGCVTVFNAAANALRSLVLQFLANVMSFDMGARLLSHLIRLPLEFFQKRHLGDLLQRFRSLEPIRQFMIGGGMAAIMDGAMAIITCTLMLVYSVPLGLLAIGVVSIYIVFRAAARSIARRYTADSMVADAREQTQFLETMRASQTIKVMGGETVRELEWRNLYAAKISASIRIGNLAIVYQSVATILSGLSDIVIFYLAAGSAIAGDMTIGMITAFMAYKGQFTGRILSLADQAIQLKMLDVQLERVADIALAAREPGLDLVTDIGESLSGSLDVTGLTFRYSPLDPPILKDLDLHVQPGEFVAIIGPSGGGKTTLLKVLLGLYTPESGELRLDGRSFGQLGPKSLRRHLGVVMQEDQLLAGTIAENVGLFEESVDMERVRECGRLAEIDDEIMSLPMQYHSLVGDMGAALSSGQRQRVLIARALYRKPKLLVLDEATAHVDAICEARLVQMIRELPMTRIVVAHSRAMMRGADRIMELRDCRLYPVEEDAFGAGPHSTLPQSTVNEFVGSLASDRALARSAPSVKAEVTGRSQQGGRWRSGIPAPDGNGGLTGGVI